MFLCLLCGCYTQVGFLNNQRVAFCERCFKQELPHEVAIIRADYGEVPETPGMFPTIETFRGKDRFVCSMCNTARFMVIYSCKCEKMMLCKRCVGDMLYRCAECESGLSYNAPLQKVMMETTAMPCMGCGTEVALGSMLRHVEQKCSVKIINENLLKMLDEMNTITL